MSKVIATTAAEAPAAGIAVGRRAGILTTSGIRYAGQVKSISTDSITIRRAISGVNVTVKWADIAEAFQFERFER